MKNLCSRYDLAVKRIKPKFNKYLMDDYFKEYNMVGLRLLPHHCELSLIKLAWSVVKVVQKKKKNIYGIQTV